MTTNPPPEPVLRFAPPRIREQAASSPQQGPTTRANMMQRLVEALEETPRTGAATIEAATQDPVYEGMETPSPVEQGAPEPIQAETPPPAEDPALRRSKAQAILDRQLAAMLALQRSVLKLERAAAGARGRERGATPMRPDPPEVIDGFWPALERLTAGLERLVPALDRHADEQLALFDSPQPARLRI